jgi:hypothetical protein
MKGKRQGERTCERIEEEKEKRGRVWREKRGKKGGMRDGKVQGGRSGTGGTARTVYESNEIL